MGTRERLVYMANQIAKNLAAADSTERAAAATADHIATYWDPRMKEQIATWLAEDPEPFSDIARAAVTLLVERGAPASQSRATTFNAVDEGGRSDAG